MVFIGAAIRELQRSKIGWLDAKGLLQKPGRVSFQLN